MAHHILDFYLDVNLEMFLEKFWYSDEFYMTYLEEGLQDKQVVIGEWSCPAGDEDDGEEGMAEHSKVRHVESQHPCKVSFPGLPSHANSLKVQKIKFEREGEVSILESNTFQGIPMADYFRVDTLWCVRRGKTKKSVNIIITGEVVFLNSTWLKGSIESNTYAELDEVFALWKERAMKFVQTFSTEIETSFRNEVSEKANGIVSMPPLFVASGGSGIISSDDEVDDFYDCEQGLDVDYLPRMRSSSGDRSDKSDITSPLLKYRDLLYRRRMGNHLLTPQELMDMYDQVERGGVASQSSRSSSCSDEGLDSSGGQSEESEGLLGHEKSERQKPMRRYIAITVVEILFVLAESSFWQINRMYKYDIRELFQVEPIEVARRVMHSFVPGKQTPLLSSPDLYGPTVAACILPQVLLVAMDSTHHGCSRSSLLGDAMVVSMCLWFGLSGLYRLFGVLVAPMLTTKHCLCLTGYSLYPWIVALFLSYIFDTYPNDYISPQLPLFLLGIPSAVAQGYVFWEYTPLAFHRKHLDLLPLTLRDLSQRHRRVTDNLLWYIPKALVLVVIAVTHYQFLWYVAHTFLPGRKHLCRITAMINPSNYADILTQKELRNFAVDVVKKVG